MASPRIVELYGGITARIFPSSHPDPEMPEAVRSNLQHVELLMAKVETLKTALADSVNALAEATARWPMSLESALVFMDELKAKEVPGRSRVYERSPAMMAVHNRTNTLPFAVYALMRSGRVVYVGRSEKWSSRVAAHRKSGRIFDAVEVYACKGYAEMCDLEAVLQQQHQPDLNVRIEKRMAS